MGKSLTRDEFIKKANVKHNNRYDYKNSVYIGCNIKVEIFCDVHGAFMMRPVHHLVGQGCQECAHENRAESNRKNAKQQRITQDEFLTRAKEKHGDFYDYSGVVITGIKHHIKINCPVHGVFKQMVQAHIINGQGCPKCFNENRLSSVTRNGKSDKTFFERAKEIHGDVYDYTKTDIMNRDKGNRVIMACLKHGDFKVRPADHISPTKKAGCQKCGYERIAMAGKKRVLTNEEYIKRATKRHGDTYDYTTVNYKGTDIGINITCKKHGVFKQNPGDHLQGNGCQKCSTFATSLMEQQWLKHMNVPEDDQQQWFTINGKRLKVDGYVKETNTIYEFFGDFWHGNINNPKYKSNDVNPKNKKTYQELYDNTLKRIDMIKQNGYNIEYIWEQDWFKQQES